MESKLKKGLQPLWYALIFGAGILIGEGNLSEGKSGKGGDINEAIRLIADQYVDSLDPVWLHNEAIQGLLRDLDPHSVYIPQSSLISYNEPLKGNFEGIGIEYFMLRDTLFVLRVFKNGPADRAGIKPSDRILKADSFVLIAKNNEEISLRIKGISGTQIQLSVLKAGSQATTNIEVKRAKIDVPSVIFSIMPDKRVGYVRINQFATNTKNEFDDAIEELREQEVSHILIDLRGNTGGFLQTAVEILDEFFDDGVILTYTMDRSGERKLYKSTSGGSCLKMKVVCLVDGQSASASELVCGAMQDHKRAKVIGVRTFGKGLVQEHFGLSDGSAIRLTVARYYTPNGRSIQKSYGIVSSSRKDPSKMDKRGGIVPDIIMKKPDYLQPMDAGKNAYDHRELMAEIMSSKRIDLFATKDMENFSKDRNLLELINKCVHREMSDSSIKLVDANQLNEMILGQLIRNYLGETEYYNWVIKNDLWVKRGKAELVN